MKLLEQLAIRIVLKYLEGSVTPDKVDEIEETAIAALKALVAKTPTKYDDMALDAVLKTLNEGGLGDVVETEILKLVDLFVAGTETKIDDQVWAILKKAIEAKV